MTKVIKVEEESFLKEITLQRIFDGDAAARMAEMTSLMLFLIRNRGIQHILQSLIAVLEKRMPYSGEVPLIADLKTTLKNYMTRYDAASKAEPVTEYMSRYDEEKRTSSESLLVPARDEIERELHQFVLDSIHVVEMRLKRNDMAKVDPNNVESEISRLIVKKIMDRFFLAADQAVDQEKS